MVHPQVKKLNAMIVEKKSAVAPVLKELRSLRQTCQVGVEPTETPGPAVSAGSLPVLTTTRGPAGSAGGCFAVQALPNG